MLFVLVNWFKIIVWKLFTHILSNGLTDDCPSTSAAPLKDMDKIALYQTTTSTIWAVIQYKDIILPV